MVMRLIIYLLITIISMCLVSITVFIDRNIITDINQLEHVKLGWPVHFLEQDQSAWDPPLPYTAKFKVNKTLSEFKTTNYILSVIIVNILFIGIFTFWRRHKSHTSFG